MHCFNLEQYLLLNNQNYKIINFIFDVKQYLKTFTDTNFISWEDNKLSHKSIKYLSKQAQTYYLELLWAYLSKYGFNLKPYKQLPRHQLGRPYLEQTINSKNKSIIQWTLADFNLSNSEELIVVSLMFINNTFINNKFINNKQPTNDTSHWYQNSLIYPYLGIDIESLNNIKQTNFSIAKKLLNPQDQDFVLIKDWLSPHSSQQLDLAFARMWSTKESFIKAFSASIFSSKGLYKTLNKHTDFSNAHIYYQVEANYYSNLLTKYHYSTYNHKNNLPNISCSHKQCGVFKQLLLNPQLFNTYNQFNTENQYFFSLFVSYANIVINEEQLDLALVYFNLMSKDYYQLDATFEKYDCYTT